MKDVLSYLFSVCKSLGGVEMRAMGENRRRTILVSQSHNVADTLLAFARQWSRPPHSDDCTVYLRMLIRLFVAGEKRTAAHSMPPAAGR